VQAGAIALAVGWLGLLLYALWPASDATDALTTSVDSSAEAFKDIKRPITEAEAALALYNEQRSKFIDQENAAQKQKVRGILEAKGTLVPTQTELLAREARGMFNDIATGFGLEGLIGTPRILEPSGAAFGVGADSVTMPSSTSSSYTETINRNGTVEVLVRAAPGTEAKVQSNTGGIPVTTTTTSSSK
jgi:hypothetical protein